VLNEKQFGFRSANAAPQTSSRRMERPAMGRHAAGDSMSAGKIGFQKPYTGKRRAESYAK
jgi:hypothetical protein